MTIINIIYYSSSTLLLNYNIILDKVVTAATYIYIYIPIQLMEVENYSFTFLCTLCSYIWDEGNVALIRKDINGLAAEVWYF